MSRVVWRADLVRLAASLPRREFDHAAALLGFEATAPAVARAARLVIHPAPVEAVGVAEPGPQLAPAETLAEASSVPFWRAETMTFPREPDSESARGVAAESSGGLTSEDLRSPKLSLFATPASPPLVPWPRLWPVLRAALQSTAAGRDPDVSTLIRLWGRGEVVRRIPCVRRSTWAARASVWVDRSARLTPFWSDQSEVLRRLRRLCGPSGLVVRWLDAPTQARLQARDGDLLVNLRPDPTTPVLVLGDLGMYEASSLREHWRRTARRLGRAGVRATALVPAPPTRWDRSTARLWGAAHWDRARSRRGLALRFGEHFWQERAARLLRLVAPTTLAQPGLLRALRLLLPAGQADAATEVDVWRHADVRAADATGLVLHARAAQRWRREFKDAVDPALQSAVSRTIKRWHEALPRELYMAEALVLHALAPAVVEPQDLADAGGFVQRMAQTARGEGGDPAVAAALERYGRASLASMPEAVYDLVPELKTVWAASFRGMRDVAVPANLDPVALYAELEAVDVERVYAVHQSGGSMVVSPVEDAQGGSPAAMGRSLVAWLVAAQPHVYVKRGTAGGNVQYPLSRAQFIPLYPGEAVDLRTDRCALTMKSWMRARGSWAVAAGRDRLGLWAEAQVSAVRFRLRWVPPGQFVMGSPEGEAGRWEDEGPQHVVDLTHGYWLGETPVTQGLWTAVMGSNPSRFLSEERPVENVSWEDCQDFFAKLNREVDGLEARLPTEAEWERACRGCTTTATWVGDLEIKGQHNAPVLDAIAWYGGNSGVGFELKSEYDSSDWKEKQYESQRAGTHSVGKKAPNPLGLMDMLGNVGEWCDDWLGSYKKLSVVDPRGPETGLNRVIRGGSWYSNARSVRAASRFGYPPDGRDVSLGFRLAGAQGSALKPAQQPEPRSGEGQSGSGTRPEPPTQDAAAVRRSPPKSAKKQAPR